MPPSTRRSIPWTKLPPWYDRSVSDRAETGPTEASCDEQGVDRSQIREMLTLTPVERLRRLEAFVESTLVIRALNEHRVR